MDDPNEKQTVQILTEGHEQTFYDCTEVEANGTELIFNDKGGDRHQFYGVSYHITKE